MLDKGVFKGVKRSELSEKEWNSIIKSHMFLREKQVPEYKLKSRFVGGGDGQNKALYGEDEILSPTDTLSALYMIVSIAAKEKRKVRTMDVGTAYLKRPVYMQINGDIAERLIALDPSWEEYQLPSGAIVVLLLKALYGCVESAKLWYDGVSGFFSTLGFKANPQDPCVLNVQRNGHQVTIYLYVDDILCSSVDDADLIWIEEALRDKYKTIQSTSGDVHHFLGQRFDFSESCSCKVTMIDYVADILAERQIIRISKTPAKDDLLEIDENSPLLQSRAKSAFHSDVAKLLFLATRA